MGFTDWIKEKFAGEQETIYDTNPCARCGIEYPEDVMHTEGSVLFCGNCMGKKKTEQDDLENKRRLMSRVSILHFHCADCKFKFKRKEEARIKICPNCGGPNFFAEGRSYK
ncbi:hypothetical protein ACFL0V_03150 [Nanoarchaeota archaeon]